MMLATESMLQSAVKCEYPQHFKDSKDIDSTMTSLDINHLISAVEQDLRQQQSNEVLDNGNPESNLNVVLEDKELWQQFKGYTNEMIVTKSGRSVCCCCSCC